MKFKTDEIVSVLIPEIRQYHQQLQTREVGRVLEVGDLQFDGSVRTRITDIRNQLLEQSSHEIQNRRDRFSSDT